MTIHRYIDVKHNLKLSMHHSIQNILLFVLMLLAVLKGLPQNIGLNAYEECPRAGQS